MERWAIAEKAALSQDGYGITLHAPENVDFKMWAPQATSVELLLFKKGVGLKKGPARVLRMNPTDGGVWYLHKVDCSTLTYYQYRIHEKAVGDFEQVNEVCDIWAKAASIDSFASQVTDISDGNTALPPRSTEIYDGSKENYVNPWKGKSYAQTLIYEMHIRDWSRVENPESTGKFIDIANGARVVKYLKSLGVTHVQLLPCFEYAQSYSDPSYNWGYNPYNYNVPESRYVQNMKEGTDAVKQFRALIQRFHKAGIAVNMDVVYNHTNGTGKDSIYDMTVPGYFYRTREDGSLSDGSGCGNELATNHEMVRKFMVESLKHWMLDYHINGFRFDLMGCHESETMAEVYRELSQIDPNVMVYGEPWTGGDSTVINGYCKEDIDVCEPNMNVNGVACFNDVFRDAIKGAEFGGFKLGQVQGVFDDESICRGLCGSREFSARIGRLINYVECHDNYTLFDKIAISNLGLTSFSGDLIEALDGDKKVLVKREDILAASYVLLAQGTPFLNGGQEFFRTKNGDENSYISSDEINQITFAYRERFSEVYFSYKGLITLRKTYPDAFGENYAARAECIRPGVTKYTTKDFLIYFNATDEKIFVDTRGYEVLVDVASGAVRFKKNVPDNVEAKRFLILKKSL